MRRTQPRLIDLHQVGPTGRSSDDELCRAAAHVTDGNRLGERGSRRHSSLIGEPTLLVGREDPHGRAGSDGERLDELVGILALTSRAP